MSGGSHIRAVGPDAAPEAQSQTPENTQEEPLSLDESWEEDWVEETVERPRYDWVIPAIAAALVLAWTAFFGWTFREPMLAGGTPADWVIWIVNWSVPVLLIGVAYLLAMRNSRRESNRFADTAALLSQEAGELETRLQVVNRELSLAREFLGSQSRDLESLGRIASERISTHADKLQSLIHSNGEQVESIASVSDTALANMQKLRDDLPVIATSARDVSNQVGNAGRTAHEQLDKLVAGFQRLNEFGVASERQVTALGKHVGTTLDRFEAQVARLDELAEERFGALKAQSEDFRADLDNREVDALAAMRARVEALREGAASLRDEIEANEERSLASLRHSKAQLEEEITALATSLRALDEEATAAASDRLSALQSAADSFDETLSARALRFSDGMAKRQDAFEAREAQASELLAQRLAELDDALDARREAQLAETEKLVAKSEQLVGRVSELNALFDSIAAQSENAEKVLGGGLEDMSSKLDESRRNLTETGKALDTLTESGIRMLEIIQSGAKQSREDLPASIEHAISALARIEERSMMLRDTMDETAQRGTAISDYLVTTRSNAEDAGESVDALASKLAENARQSGAHLDELRKKFGEIESDGERVLAMSRGELQSAIGELVEASRKAFETIENDSEEAVARTADRIGGIASEAIGRAMEDQSKAAVEDLEMAASRASQMGRETAKQLRDQLAKVNELAGNLELRVNRTRELAEERVDNDFSRRMALITESLNSNAIDIAKAFSADITDTAWASYLKGDRGIFTRRAVSLIDNSEAREIVELYESDGEFREHVSRYIHDFEAMLRSVLSTRDGNALGVTVLGSDMGKLYVALAQAIERLRN